MAAPMKSVVVMNLLSKSFSSSKYVRAIGTTTATSAKPADEAHAKRVDITPVSLGAVKGSTEKAEKISKAMKAYLERSQAHNEFMASEIAEYEIGKRHLANIMGVDPENFSQQDIDRAIEYLLPSGLYDKKARPLLKHPSEVIPKRKAAQFDVDGRPFHSFFYTAKPNFVQALHDCSLKIEQLRHYEDSMLAKNQHPDISQELHLAGSQWYEKTVLEETFQERLSDVEYKNLINIVDFLSKLPYSYREKDFILKFRRVLQKVSLENKAKELIQDEKTGRFYQEAQGKRKKAVADIRLWTTGTGQMTVNGDSLVVHFPRIMDREQILFPLHLTEKLGYVDFEATVSGGGTSGQAGALRLALSTALLSIVSTTTAEKMRLAGLLTRDPRAAERQKTGQQGARRKYTWKKR